MSTQYDINLSNGSVLTTLYALESDGPGNVSTPRLIQQTDTTLKTFTLHGDLSYRFVPGFHFTVDQSAGNLNDGVYRTVTSSFVPGPNHTIIQIDVGPIVPPMTKNDIVDDSPPLGQIYYSISASSALHLPGKGTVNYGEQLVENLVRSVEHWASAEEPGVYPNGFSAPVVGSPAEVGTPMFGQLWWNTTQEVMFRYTPTSAPDWTSNINMGTGSLFFQDTENPFDPTTNIQLTAAGDDVGMSITTLLDPNPLDSILNVYSDDMLTARFRVEHEGFFGGINALNVAGSAGGEDSWIDTNLSINRGHSDSMGGAVAAPHTAPAGVALDVGSGDIRVDDAEGLVSVTGARVLTDGTGRTFSVRPANAAANRFTVQSSVGTDLLFVDPEGNVGVNRVPTATVDILGTNLTDHLRVDDAADNELFLVTSTVNPRVEVGAGAVDTDFVVDTNVLYVDSTNDYVGVNQSTPTSALDVTGDGHFTGRVGINNAVPAGAVFLEVTGDIQFNSQARGSNQSAAAPTYSFINDLTSGMFLNAVGELAFASNGVEYMRFDVGTNDDIQLLNADLDLNGADIRNRAGTGIDIGGDSISLGVAAATSGFNGVDNTGAGDGGNVQIRAGLAFGAGQGGDLVLAAGQQKPIALLPGQSADNMELRFRDRTGPGYTSLIHPGAGNPGVQRSWTLMTDDPAAVAGQILTTDASGVLSFSVLPSSIPVDADGDTGLEVELAADDDTIRFNTGDAITGYGAVTDLLVVNSGGWTVDMGTADTAATAGADISFTAGTGNTTGNGGNISLNPGQDGGGGLPGQVILGEDGAATLPSLAFASNTGTGLFVPAANALAFAGNGTEFLRYTGVFLEMGVPRFDGAADFNWTFNAGADVSDNGGNGFIFNASNGGATSNGGTISFNSGDSGAGGSLGGAFNVNAGNGTNVGGGVTLNAGNGPTPGSVTLNGGNSSSGNNQGGQITIEAGDGSGIGNGGPLVLRAGNPGGGGFPSFGGFIELQTGNVGTVSGNGDIRLRLGDGPALSGVMDDFNDAPTESFRIRSAGGDATRNEGRDFLLETGQPFPGSGLDSGDLYIRTANGLNEATSGSGNITINTGDAGVGSSASGGGIQVYGGLGDGTGTGGDIDLIAGDSGDLVGAVPGNVSLTAGNATSGSDAPGGDVLLTAGAGSTPSAGFADAAVATAPGGGFVIGLAPGMYDVDVTFDVGGLQTLTITTVGGETYTAVAGLIAGVIGSGTCTYVNGAFRFTSATLGSTSTALVAAGTAGSPGGDLFAAITVASGNAVSFPAPVVGTDGMPGGIVASLSPHVILPPGGLVLPPIPKATLSLGVGLAALPPGSMALIIDAAPAPAFVLAAVDPAGTWTRMDTGAVLA